MTTYKILEIESQVVLHFADIDAAKRWAATLAKAGITFVFSKN